MSSATYYHRVFRDQIVKESNGKTTYQEAIVEFDNIDYCELGKGQCICTHDIVKKCIVVSRETGKQLVIGNDCIKRFFPPEIAAKAAATFRELSRITRDCLKCKRRYPMIEGDTTGLCGSCERLYAAVLCSDCGKQHIVPEGDRKWRRRCLTCYKKRKASSTGRHTESLF